MTSCLNHDCLILIFIHLSASFLDLYLEIDDSGQISTKIYVQWDDFNFKIINFPNMCSNIPASPAYGVYISQLIRNTKTSSNYSDFLKRHWDKLGIIVVNAVLYDNPSFIIVSAERFN
jgi:hypothetical protein